MLARLVITRNLGVPLIKRLRLKLLALWVASHRPSPIWNPKVIVVRNHFLARTGSRKKTLFMGLLIVGKINKNVLLYRKLQPAYHLTYPIFTPWKRRVKSLGQKVAPVIPIGGGGSNIDLQHFLGLSLLKLGGMRY